VTRTITRRSASLGLLLGLQGCNALVRLAPDGAVASEPRPPDGEFVMEDGARLPYRAWLPPDGLPPDIVVLGLHGFNDSRNAWEIPAPEFQRAGIAIFAPDQRGFGQAPDRGFWAGTTRMAEDAAEIARTLRARFPDARLILMGESMGGAVLMRAATMPVPPPADGYVLIAPAVWGRAQMGILLSSGLWIVSSVAPSWRVTGAEVPIRIRPSDNRAALLALARDPLTINRTRFDTLRGLTNAMDAAQAAAPDFRAPGLFLYGGQDRLVPPEATLALWRKLPEGARRALYPHGYHLLLRDLDRAIPIADVIAWMRDPATLLPSEAGITAASWQAAQP
jgi:alpha-beta hydrolase superfamily lysophospholipase